MRYNKEETRNPTLKNVRKRMLGGLSDYAQTGCSEEMAKMLEKATCYLMDYGFAPCEGFTHKKGERAQLVFSLID